MIPSLRAFAVCLTAALTLPLEAGDLEPPGEPAPTLPQIEPRRPIRAGDLPLTINQRGSSWYFTENIAFPTMDAAAVTISERYVTIDFNGFSLEGPSGISGGANSVGILGTSTAREVTIRNGTIASFGGDGIRLAARGGDVTQMHVFDCGDEGIELAGENGRVTNCTVQACTGEGVLVADGSVVERCVARGNANGIRAAQDCAITGCSAANNTAAGIRVDTGCTVSHCAASGNTEAGIFVFNSATVIGSSARANGTSGILGFGSGMIVVDCLAEDNGGSGIHANLRATVSRCTAQDNGLSGITAVEAVIVAECTAASNDQHGIEVSRGCVVRDCLSRSNGGAIDDGTGIQVNQGDNRIEGNSVTGNDIGIRTAGFGGNIVVRNTASGIGQDDYGQINANTDLGPIRINFGAEAGGPWDNFEN